MQFHQNNFAASILQFCRLVPARTCLPYRRCSCRSTADSSFADVHPPLNNWLQYLLRPRTTVKLNFTHYPPQQPAPLKNLSPTEQATPRCHPNKTNAKASISFFAFDPPKNPPTIGTLMTTRKYPLMYRPTKKLNPETNKRHTIFNSTMYSP